MIVFNRQKLWVEEDWRKTSLFYLCGCDPWFYSGIPRAYAPYLALPLDSWLNYPCISVDKILVFLAQNQTIYKKLKSSMFNKNVIYQEANDPNFSIHN